MSTVTTCNYCGLVIGDNDLSANVSTIGRFPSGGSLRHSLERWEAHYHTNSADGTSCFDRVYGAVDLVEQMGPSLESIPVATDEEIASLRPVYVAAEIEAAVARHDPTMEVDRPGYRRRQAVLNSPGGIVSLGLPWGIEKRLDEAGVLTVATLSRRASERTLADVPGIGPGRLKVIEEALAAQRAKSPEIVR